MMNTDYPRITNHEAVIDFFGSWPTFDDFEVVSILLERMGIGGGVGPSLTIRFLAVHPKVGPESQNQKNFLVTLRFSDVECLKLENFNHQNAINGFAFSPTLSARLGREIFTVELVQGFGVGCTFECDAIEVLSVEPSEMVTCS